MKTNDSDTVNTNNPLSRVGKYDQILSKEIQSIVTESGRAANNHGRAAREVNVNAWFGGVGAKSWCRTDDRTDTAPRQIAQHRLFLFPANRALHVLHLASHLSRVLRKRID